MLLKVLSSLILKISSYGTSTDSLENLFQCLTTLIVKNLFLKSSLNLLSFWSYCPLCPAGSSIKSLSINPVSLLEALKGHNKCSKGSSLHQMLKTSALSAFSSQRRCSSLLTVIIKSVSLHVRGKNVGDHIKGPAEAQLDYISSPSFVQWCSHSIPVQGTGKTNPKFLIFSNMDFQICGRFYLEFEEFFFLLSKNSHGPDRGTGVVVHQTCNTSQGHWT